LKAIPKLGEPTATSIWLGGCAIREVSNPRIQLGITQDRVYAERQVEVLNDEAGLSYAAINVDWNTSEHDIGVDLDCRRGILSVHLVRDE
jgi:hypothetical protein